MITAQTITDEQILHARFAGWVDNETCWEALFSGAREVDGVEHRCLDRRLAARARCAEAINARNGGSS